MSEIKSAEDLLQELRTETENTKPADAEVIEEVPTPSAGEFEEPVPAPQTASEAAAEPTLNISQAKSTAISYIKKFSSVLKMVFTPLYKKRILAPDDEEKMRAFVAKNRSLSEKQKEEAIHSDHELSKVADRFDRYMKAIEEIPLNKDEVDDLAEPLADLIMKYKKLQLSPEAMFGLALVFTMLPRLTHLMPDMGKIFTGDK